MPGVFLGATEVSLSAKGRMQVTEKSSYLASKKIQKIFCSTQIRCRETAALLALSAPVVYDPCLKEIDFGLWEGKNYNDIYQNFPQDIARWMADENAFTFPGGESLTNFRCRVNAALATLEQEDAETILVISHGGIIRHLICAFLRQTWKSHLLYEVCYGGITEITLFDQGGVLTGFNK